MNQSTDHINKPIDVTTHPRSLSDLASFKEICESLGIALSTGHDWRNKKSPRYKQEFANLAIYLSPRCIRFSRKEVSNWAENHRSEVLS